ncbi:MAG: hypothetical protein AVDCRST_MAG87-2712 [uncultured Thermomicrobiales bacterium]|uniref:Uncharacterized protein n=1 Tax=uncultured Thermomicrobiales bacterium TaxID=1645740 RepID=A0A6J4VBH4_9BACT|nr:MAG: hypothetical protein AVDCRST_MAG87-2712 [uncultured Thermomicrobiales bacterium]
MPVRVGWWWRRGVKMLAGMQEVRRQVATPALSGAVTQDDGQWFQAALRENTGTEPVDGLPWRIGYDFVVPRLTSFDALSVGDQRHGVDRIGIPDTRPRDVWYQMAGADVRRDVPDRVGGVMARVADRRSGMNTSAPFPVSPVRRHVRPDDAGFAHVKR